MKKKEFTINYNDTFHIRIVCTDCLDRQQDG